MTFQKHVKSQPALIFLQFAPTEDVDQKETSFKKLPSLLSDHVRKRPPSLVYWSSVGVAILAQELAASMRQNKFSAVK